MRRAKELAKPGDVVLLSTGYASYDQFLEFRRAAANSSRPSPRGS